MHATAHLDAVVAVGQRIQGGDAPVHRRYLVAAEGRRLLGHDGSQRAAAGAPPPPRLELRQPAGALAMLHGVARHGCDGGRLGQAAPERALKN